MNHLKIKAAAIIAAILTCGIFVVSCRGSSGKKAAKLIIKGEKIKILQYSGDIARKAKFELLHVLNVMDQVNISMKPVADAMETGKNLKLNLNRTFK